MTHEPLISTIVVQRLRPLAWLALAGAAGCVEVERAEYPTYAAAEHAGAVTRGWIPAFVPRSAVKISEAHDLDVNTQRLRFRAPESDLRRMTAHLRPLTLAAARTPGVRSPDLAGEWPSEVSAQPLRQTPRAALSFYAVQDSGVVGHCLAIDWATRTVYVWSCTGVT